VACSDADRERGPILEVNEQQNSDGGVSDGKREGCEDVCGGPKMIEVTSPNGVYRIDETPVTQKQYAEFLASTKRTPGTEHRICSQNTTYEPTFEDDNGTCTIGPDENAGIGEFNFYMPDVSPNHPVFCVDWCDAVAFCEWAGKRLCGRIGGGIVDANEAMNAFFDHRISEWHNVCTNGGETLFLYGGYEEIDYDPEACGTGPSFSWARDVKFYPTCRGVKDGFADVYDMAGPWPEYENAFWYPANDGTSRVFARLQSGEPPESGCYGGFTASPLDRVATFRCCKD